jgi:hypothetical protein
MGQANYSEPISFEDMVEQEEISTSTESKESENEEKE